MCCRWQRLEAMTELFSKPKFKKKSGKKREMIISAQSIFLLSVLNPRTQPLGLKTKFSVRLRQGLMTSKSLWSALSKYSTKIKTVK